MNCHEEEKKLLDDLKKIKVFFIDSSNILINLYKEIKKSDSKINVIIKNKNIISLFFTVLVFIFGIFGFYLQDKNIIDSILSTISLFGLSFPNTLKYETPIDVLSSLMVFFSAILAAITLFLVAVLYFLKDSLEKKYIKDISKKNHTVLFGLGEINRSFLNTIKDEKKKEIIIVESDLKNRYIEDFRKKDFVILLADGLTDTTFDIINFKTTENIIIAIGEDRHNIELAKRIIDKYTIDDGEVKIIIHIMNKELDILFHTQFIQKNDKQINIKSFSFYEEVAKNLFKKYEIDGNTTKYINSSISFKTIVIGDGVLLERVLYHIALLSHLPNENKHIVYIVGKNADELFVKIQKELYYRKEKQSFPHLEIIPSNLDKDKLDFYSDAIWHLDDLVNVIVAYDEESKNLDLAVSLYNRIYLQKAIDKIYIPNVLFGIYDEMVLSRLVDDNKSEFNNFYTYGALDEILNYIELIEEESNILGKLIHYDYEGYLENGKYSPNKLINYKAINKQISETEKEKNDIDHFLEMNRKWYDNANYNDKLSSIEQSKMIDLKLKSLSLKKEKALDKIDINELIKSNRLIFDSKLDEKFNGRYSFPNEFDSTNFKKLIRMEHNRWNSYHWINGFKYDHGEKEKFEKEEKDMRKKKKIHDCLIPLEKFDKESIKNTIIYDIYSFMHIPNYLAELGYKIIPYDEFE